MFYKNLSVTVGVVRHSGAVLIGRALAAAKSAQATPATQRPGFLGQSYQNLLVGLRENSSESDSRKESDVVTKSDAELSTVASSISGFEFQSTVPITSHVERVLRYTQQDTRRRDFFDQVHQLPVPSNPQLPKANCGLGIMIGKGTDKVQRTLATLKSMACHRFGEGVGKSGHGIGVYLGWSPAAKAKMNAYVHTQLSAAGPMDTSLSASIKSGDYGAGLLFIDPKQKNSTALLDAFTQYLSDRGIEVFAHRELETHPEELGALAKSGAPKMIQFFAKKPPGIDELTFQDFVFRETKNFLLEKKGGENEVVCFGTDAMVFKGMATAEQFERYLPFLTPFMSEEFAPDVTGFHGRMATNKSPKAYLAHPHQDGGIIMQQNGEFTSDAKHKNLLFDRSVIQQRQIIYYPDGKSDTVTASEMMNVLSQTTDSALEAAFAMILPVSDIEGKEPSATELYYRLNFGGIQGPIAMVVGTKARVQDCTQDPDMQEGDPLIVFARDRDGKRPLRYVVRESEAGPEIEILSELTDVQADAEHVRHVSCQQIEFINLRTGKGGVYKPEENTEREAYFDHLLKTKITRVGLDSVPRRTERVHTDITLNRYQALAGWNVEDISIWLNSMKLSSKGVDPLVSMGNTDIPWLDSETIRMGESPYQTVLKHNLLTGPADTAAMTRVYDTAVMAGSRLPTTSIGRDMPKGVYFPSGSIISRSQLNESMNKNNFRRVSLEVKRHDSGEYETFQESVDRIFKEIQEISTSRGTPLFVLSDREAILNNKPRIAMFPALLALKEKVNNLETKPIMRVGELPSQENNFIINLGIEGSEARYPEMALCMAYGANFYCPWLALETIEHQASSALESSRQQTHFLNRTNNCMTGAMSLVCCTNPKGYIGAKLAYSQSWNPAEARRLGLNVPRSGSGGVTTESLHRQLLQHYSDVNDGISRGEEPTLPYLGKYGSVEDVEVPRTFTPDDAHTIIGSIRNKDGLSGYEAFQRLNTDLTTRVPEFVAFRMRDAAVHIAVVGTGPSAWAVVENALERWPDGTVTVFDKSMVPGGNIRKCLSGLHEDKQVLEKYKALMQDPRVEVLTNVKIGPEGALGAEELDRHFSHVFHCTGAQEDKVLELPESSPGVRPTVPAGSVINSSQLVEVYNGDLSRSDEPKQMPPRLTPGQPLVTIGGGNAALDALQWLGESPERLEQTFWRNPSSQAFNRERAQHRQVIENHYYKGPGESSFTLGALQQIKRELGPHVRFQVDCPEYLLNEESAKNPEAMSFFKELSAESLEEVPSQTVTVRFVFASHLQNIEPNQEGDQFNYQFNQRVKAEGTWKATDNHKNLQTGAVINCTGRQSNLGLVFGSQPKVEGRKLLDFERSSLAGLSHLGWGQIGSSSMDGFQAVESIEPEKVASSAHYFQQTLLERHVPFLTKADLQAVYEEEKRVGHPIYTDREIVEVVVKNRERRGHIQAVHSAAPIGQLSGTKSAQEYRFTEPRTVQVYSEEDSQTVDIEKRGTVYSQAIVGGGKRLGTCSEGTCFECLAVADRSIEGLTPAEKQMREQLGQMDAGFLGAMRAADIEAADLRLACQIKAHYLPPDSRIVHVDAKRPEVYKAGFKMVTEQRKHIPEEGIPS